MNKDLSRNSRKVMWLKAITTDVKESMEQESSASSTMVVNVRYVVLISRLSTEKSARNLLRYITLFLSRAQMESIMLTQSMT